MRRPALCRPSPSSDRSIGQRNRQCDPLRQVMAAHGTGGYCPGRPASTSSATATTGTTGFACALPAAPYRTVTAGGTRSVVAGSVVAGSVVAGSGSRRGPVWITRYTAPAATVTTVTSGPDQGPPTEATAACSPNPRPTPRRSAARPPGLRRCTLAPIMPGRPAPDAPPLRPRTAGRMSAIPPRPALLGRLATPNNHFLLRKMPANVIEGLANSGRPR